jgi:protein phosphatase 2C family protein 2/3
MGVRYTDNEPSGGKMEESISEEKARVGHNLPEIHVDYYGPRGHKPAHH